MESIEGFPSVGVARRTAVAGTVEGVDAPRTGSYPGPFLTLPAMDTGTVHDVPYFDQFARVYDLVLPGTDRQPLVGGLELAERQVDCVLDLGGGTGRAARALPDESLVFDGSYPMLFRARSHDLPTLQGDVRSLPLQDESVDGVVVVDALHHFPSPNRAISEATRVLRPGGALVIREFDPTTIRGRVLVFGERVIGFESTFFTPADVADMLADAGLAVTIQERGFVYTVTGVKPTAPGVDGGDQ